MPTWLRIIIGIIIVAALAVGGMYMYINASNDDDQYSIIASHWTQSGRFIDYAQDTGVEDISDIRYYVNQDTKEVEITYGYILLTYTFDEMKDKAYKEKLAYIGITYDVKPTGDDFRLYWQGEELERWYKSTIVG